MTAKSHFRGHPIEWVDGRWVYADTKEALPGFGGFPYPRYCAKCGLKTPLGEGEVDPCLGVLPGVDNACCGHGVREESYIRFENGTVVKGFVVERGPKG